MEKTIKLGLVAGRHEIKDVTDYVFDEIKDVLDFVAINNTATAKLAELDFDHLHLYVTGLTAATIEVVKVATKMGKKITLFHFDRDSGTYLPQEF